MHINALARLKNLSFIANYFFLFSFILFSFGWAVFNLLKSINNIEINLSRYKAGLS